MVNLSCHFLCAFRDVWLLVQGIVTDVFMSWTMFEPGLWFFSVRTVKRYQISYDGEKMNTW